MTLRKSTDGNAIVLIVAMLVILIIVLAGAVYFSERTANRTENAGEKCDKAGGVYVRGIYGTSACVSKSAVIKL